MERAPNQQALVFIEYDIGWKLQKTVRQVKRIRCPGPCMGGPCHFKCVREALVQRWHLSRDQTEGTGPSGGHTLPGGGTAGVTGPLGERGSYIPKMMPSTVGTGE